MTFPTLHRRHLGVLLLASAINSLTLLAAKLGCAVST